MADRMTDADVERLRLERDAARARAQRWRVVAKRLFAKTPQGEYLRGLAVCANPACGHPRDAHCGYCNADGPNSDGWCPCEAFVDRAVDAEARRG